MDIDTYTLIDLARVAARAAGDIHRAYRSRGFETTSKTRHNDRLTEADIAAERQVATIIGSTFGDHNIVGEEESYQRTNSPYTWYVDPLDGTNNYANDIPYYSSSVAVAVGNRLTAAAVYATPYDELYWAGDGAGAFCNGRPIQVSTVESLHEAILITGCFYDEEGRMFENLEVSRRFLDQRVMGIRHFGSAALDMCMVAGGRVDGFWEPRLSSWDYAAAALIVREAGGMVGDFTGATLEARADDLPRTPIVASNGRLHQPMLETIESAGKRHE